MVLIF